MNFLDDVGLIRTRTRWRPQRATAILAAASYGAGRSMIRFDSTGTTQ